MQPDPLKDGPGKYALQNRKDTHARMSPSRSNLCGSLDAGGVHGDIVRILTYICRGAAGGGIVVKRCGLCMCRHSGVCGKTCQCMHTWAWDDG